MRGATPAEIVADLGRGGDGQPSRLRPEQLGPSDDIDLWCALSLARRPSRTKLALRRALKVVQALSGQEVVPEITMAVRKEGSPAA